MDKNQLTGLLAMLALLLVYFQFFAPDPEEYATENNPIADTTIVQQPTAEIVAEPVPIEPGDSAAMAVANAKYGSLATFAIGNQETTEIETDVLNLQFSNKGGFVKRLELREYNDHLGNPAALIIEDFSEMNIFFDAEGKSLSLADFYFEKEIKEYGDSTEIRFYLGEADMPLISQVYTVFQSGYEVNYRIESNGFEKTIDPKDLNYTWTHKVNRIEPHLRDPRQRTTVRYAEANGEVDYLSATSTSHEEASLEGGISWIAFKQKYFTVGILSDAGFSKAFVTSDLNEADTTAIKYLSMTASIPYTSVAGNTADFKFYFGPNAYYALDEFAPGFKENLNLGWNILSFVNRFLILPIWRVLETFVTSYPVLIIILVLIIRLLLSPLTYKSHISMAKMRVLKPELDEIKEKHGEDMQKAQQEQMALYQKVGINPLSGCIPMLLQFPILVALFYYIPNAIELRQVSFLWAEDLSTYDSILDFGFEIPFYGDHISLFTLLMTVSTLLYTWSNSQMTTVQGPMKSLQYVMPVMLLFFFNSYSSGLTYYYFISNIVSFGQIFLFRKIIDEEKIKKVLEENRKKNANKKKSKFQQRLEDAMKANEQARKKDKGKK